MTQGESVKAASSMMRLRMFMGLTSALHGIGGLHFDHGSGVGYLVAHSEQGWQFSAALIFGGVVMLWAASREWFGERRRRCRTVSAFVLTVTWIAVFFHSFEGGADSITLIAPAYVFFGLWAWLGEATVHRRRATGEAGA